MRKYCVLLLAIALLMPSGEVRASEATMVASLSITERAASEMHETVVLLPAQHSEKNVAIVWGTPLITVTARTPQGTIDRIAIAGQPIDFSGVTNVQEVSIY